MKMTPQITLCAIQAYDKKIRTMSGYVQCTIMASTHKDGSVTMIPVCMTSRQKISSLCCRCGPT